MLATSIRRVVVMGVDGKAVDPVADPNALEYTSVPYGSRTAS
jgi:hypothetical protein